MSSGEVQDSFTKFCTTADPPEEKVTCFTLKFVIAFVIIGSICLLGMIGNFLSLFVLAKIKESSDFSTTVLLSSLCVADIFVVGFLFCVKSFPSYCFYTWKCSTTFYEDVFPWMLFVLWPLVTVVHCISRWLTVLVTIHRYIAVCLPHKAAVYCTKSRALKQVAVLVILNIVYSLPFFLDKKLYKVINEDNSTSLVRSNSALGNSNVYQWLYKTVLFYVIMYGIPLIMLAVFTGFLLRALAKARIERQRMTGHKVTPRDDLTIMLLAVVFVYMICQPWEPLRRIMEHLHGQFVPCYNHQFYLGEMASFSTALNSGVNFALFCLFGSKFRNVLSEFCHKKNTEEALDISVYAAGSTSSTNASNHIYAIAS